MAHPVDPHAQHQAANIAKECSRPRSRLAAEIITLVLGDKLTLASRAGSFAFPRTESRQGKGVDGSERAACPLDTSRDVFGTQERAKERVRSGYWRCALCGKAFVSEEYIDMHMDNRHADALLKPGAGEPPAQCMAELCDMLHCDTFEAQATNTHFEGLSAALSAGCDARDAARRAEECARAATACFPPTSGPASVHLKRTFEHEVCRMHTCDADVLAQPSAFLSSGARRFDASSGGNAELGHVAMAVLGGLALFIIIGIYVSIYFAARCDHVHTRTIQDDMLLSFRISPLFSLSHTFSYHIVLHRIMCVLPLLVLILLYCAMYRNTRARSDLRRVGKNPHSSSKGNNSSFTRIITHSIDTMRRRWLRRRRKLA